MADDCLRINSKSFFLSELLSWSLNCTLTYILGFYYNYLEGFLEHPLLPLDNIFYKRIFFNYMKTKRRFYDG